MQTSCSSVTKYQSQRTQFPHLPFFLFVFFAPHYTVTQVMWNVLAWTMLPFPGVDDFILQKDIPVFGRNVLFFSPGLGGYYGLNQLIDVTACDGLLLH